MGTFCWFGLNMFEKSNASQTGRTTRDFLGTAEYNGPEVQHMQKALSAATGLVAAHIVLPPPPSILKEQLRSRKSFYPETCRLSV